MHQIVGLQANQGFVPPNVAPALERPYFDYTMKQPERLDPKERAREKQRSRDEDARALAAGEKSREQLQRENGHFTFPNARVSLRGAKPLE